MSKTLSFSIEPPLLNTWITPEIREKNMILVDMQIDSDVNEDRRIDLQLAFNPLSIPRGQFKKRDYYIGCSGAEITIDIDNGEVQGFTNLEDFQVAYEKGENHIRYSDLVLEPKMDLKNKISASLGAIKHSKSKETSYKTSFTGKENTLVPVPTRKSVKWLLHSHRGQKAVYDYLAGSLHLCLKMSITRDEVNSGKIKVRPSDVTFFGPDRSPLNKRKNVLMWFYLKMNNYQLYNENGIETVFKENKHGN